jgi:hypothetical protein
LIFNVDHFRCNEDALTTNQREGEILQDYTKRFCDIAGHVILTKFVKAIDGYNKMDTKL